jgi:hypothetical protein
MNSRVEPDVILRPVVRHRQQHRPALLVGLVGDLEDLLQQPLALERAREQQLDLHVGGLWAEHRVDPLARDEVEDRQRVGPGLGERGQVIAPHLARPVLDPGRPRPLDRAHPRRPVGQHPAVLEQHPQHARRRHPHLAFIRAAVRELAMRAVDLAPAVGQRQDLGHLGG